MEFLNQLGNVLQFEQILIPGSNNSNSKLKLEKYCLDWREKFSGTPLAIVFPHTTEQVANIVKICLKHKISIVSQGGNTSLCGASIPNSSGKQLLVNLSKFNKIIDCNVQNNSITLECGCTLAMAQNYALQKQRLYPLSLPSEQNCTIGGNLSTNAGGVSVLKYGNTRQLCLGLEAVLPNGEIYNNLHNLYKNNMGYDLKHLLIGAEGTLGIITKACMRLFPLPHMYHNLWLGAQNIEEVMDIFLNLNNDYFGNISSFELMNLNSLNCVNTHFKQYLSMVPHYTQYNWHILIELEQYLTKLDIVNYCQQKYNVLASEQYLAQTNASSKLWQIRHSIPQAQKLSGGNIKHDISLSLDKTSHFINLMEKPIKEIDKHAQFIIFGHAGDGNLHYNIVSMANLNNKIQDAVYNMVLSLGGSIAAEHGIGKLKTSLLKNSLNQTHYNLAKNLKYNLDPYNLFNPEVIFI